MTDAFCCIAFLLSTNRTDRPSNIQQVAMERGEPLRCLVPATTNVSTYGTRPAVRWGLGKLNGYEYELLLLPPQARGRAA